ncbi:Homeobox-leucine zipper protein ATHB-8 [Camellia lanceoleosa]|uniref:Homeobox-leucine zipper protein ATHB-8 n=1 Tax=Camellia lanceoleosa TaxID=1840588 RepID=A0ACC0FLD5_9ERIC|nr:Homeobox-leucine zipper protein ATHB-8 [Camellia lanceoleosa]
MIKKIKAKERKTTDISDYEYGGKKVKVEKEKEHKDETISNKCREKQKKKATNIRLVNKKLTAANKLLKEEHDCLQKQVSHLFLPRI